MLFARLPWYVADPLIGLLMIGLRMPLNRGYIDFAENALSPSRLGFRAFLLLGLILGGALYAVAAGSITPSLSYGTAGGLLSEQLPAPFAIFLGAGLVQR